MSDKHVRFCILCGERDDNPARSQWCDPDPVGTDYPYMHRWGSAERVFDDLGREGASA